MCFCFILFISQVDIILHQAFDFYKESNFYVLSIFVLSLCFSHPSRVQLKTQERPFAKLPISSLVLLFSHILNMFPMHIKLPVLPQGNRNYCITDPKLASIGS